MKQYDRESKKWITDEEREQLRSKREKCKGGRDHDFVEMLPYGMYSNEKYQGNPQPYYDIEKQIIEFTRQKYEELEAIGILSKYIQYRLKMDDYRPYVCATCGKRTHKMKI